MDRVSATGYQTIGGKRYYQDVNLGSGIQGTDWSEVWANGVQESIVETIAASGQTPTDSTAGASDTQLLDAILAFAGANVQTIASTPGSPLTAINAGLVVVNATSGNIAITLPASAGLGGQVQRWKFVRTDATTNTVSISFHAGDTTLIGAGAGPVALAASSTLDLIGDGTTHWALPNISIFSGIYADTGTANAMVVTLNPAPASLAAIQGIPFMVKKGSSASSGALTIAVNGLTATAPILADGTAFSSTNLWPANATGIVVYNGTSFVVLNILNPGSVLTTANFTGSNQSLGTSGYQILPGGVILQWVSGATVAATSAVDGSTNALQTITWPLTFPNACRQAFVSTECSTNTYAGDAWWQLAGAPTASGVAVQLQTGGGASTTGCNFTPTAFAIGY